MALTPVDQPARTRARDDHDTSLVIAAGAGTGKTTLLVDRVEALVLRGRARLDQIAAVTFTENAATTLKLRLRERLERARQDGARSATEQARASAALESLELAPIATIHALCAAILQERPLECGVVPGFRVADEAEMDVLFASAWEAWLSERLVHGDDTLLDALEQGIPLESQGPFGERTSLRGLARVLIEQRDLAPLVSRDELDPVAWRLELLDQAARLEELLLGVPEADALCSRLRALVAFAEQARFLSGRELQQHLLRLQSVPKNYGFKAHWPSPERLEAARAVAAWTGEARARFLAARAATLHGRLVESLLGVARLYEERKTAAGVLDFLDLLMKTRAALVERSALRGYVRERFRYLLIDEFQDTDPLQVEIAESLARELPFGLTLVGDAKQSIYRFRRAEVALFTRLAARAVSEPGQALLTLSQNFRSRPAILRFVNRAFGELIRESASAGQAAYEPLAPPPDLGDEPAVIALRFPGELLSGEDLLAAEARALTALVARAAQGAYTVRDVASGQRRPSRAGDVLVLARRLTQVRHLEDALDRAQVKVTVEGGKSFFDRQEVHELLATLRAIDDPSDRTSLVAALRSSFLGVSDRDIVAYALSGGQLGVERPVDEERPVGAALGPAVRLLQALNRERTRLSVPALVERLLDETRVLAALTFTRRGAAQIANLEKAVALARSASELGVLTLRGFTRLLQERIESAREEPDLPATRPGDPHTVRLLSIHRAKGLEAPIVAFYDTADDYRVQPDAIPLWDRGQIAIGFRQGCQPPGWDELRAPEEARAWAEARRLLYVAATRARDLLVVPCPPASARPGGFWKDLSRFLPDEDNADVLNLDALTLPDPSAEWARANLRALQAAQGGDAAAARWEGERRELIRQACEQRLRPVRATALSGAQGPPPGLTGEGPGGRDFGTLVHGVLERVALDRPDEALPLARALCGRLGLASSMAEPAAEAVRRVLETSVLERARRASQVYRELRLWFPEGDELVEGRLDLVFEEQGQLVLVDYKSDRVSDDEAELLARAEHHKGQLQLYGRGLARASGQPVRERLVLFTALGRAVAV